MFLPVAAISIIGMLVITIVPFKFIVKQIAACLTRDKRLTHYLRYMPEAMCCQSFKSSQSVFRSQFPYEGITK